MGGARRGAAETGTAARLNQNKNHRPIWSRFLGLDVRRAKALVVLALSVSMIASWIVAWVLVAESRTAAVERTFADARTQSRLLASEWSQVVVQIGALQRLGVIVTRAKMAGDSTDAAMDELRQYIARLAPDIVQVSAIGLDGGMLWSNLPLPEKPIDLSGREHFRAIVVDGKETFTGTPVIGKVSGQWTVQMAAAARDKHGTLLAVVVVSVNTGMLARILPTANASRHGIFALIRRDGTVLMRSRALRPEDARPLAIPHFDEVFSHGSFEQLLTSPRDGVRRFYAMTAVPGTDTAVGVGIGERAAMASFEAIARGIWEQTVLLDIALAIAAAAIIFALRKNRLLTAERIRAAAEAEREGLMRQFADLATDAIGLLDDQFHYLYSNGAVEKMLGIAPDALLGVRAGGYIVDEDRALLQAAIAKISQDGGTTRVTLRMRHTDGSVCWWESEIVRVESDAARTASPLRYISISRDVTERKRAEASLVEANQNLSAVLGQSGIMLFRESQVPGGAHLLRLVGAREMTWGWSADELECPGFLRGRLDDASRERFQKMREVCQNTGHAVEELQFQGSAGDWRWMRVQSTRIRNDAELIELMHFVSDITPEIENRQHLQQTERLAVIGEVCSGIAHEVNQPLAVIAMAASNGLSELEGLPCPSDRVAAKFHRIEKQALRVGKIIGHIRSFGRRDLADAERFAVADVIDDALQLAQARLTVSGVVSRVDVAPGIPMLHTTRTVLEQVLMNLIVNACDAYTDNPVFQNNSEQRLIEVSAVQRGDSCLIGIADHAGGIPPEVIGKIFLPFFTTKGTDKGTGLGLAFCATSVREMNGRINVYNRQNGAVFEISLPFDSASPSRPQSGDFIQPSEKVVAQ